jgi:hypothetical protein
MEKRRLGRYHCRACLQSCSRTDGGGGSYAEPQDGGLLMNGWTKLLAALWVSGQRVYAAVRSSSRIQCAERR